jgi:hypothetical protein
LEKQGETKLRTLNIDSLTKQEFDSLTEQDRIAAIEDLLYRCIREGNVKVVGIDPITGERIFTVAGELKAQNDALQGKNLS